MIAFRQIELEISAFNRILVIVNKITWAQWLGRYSGNFSQIILDRII
jgi:hypothetical protein